MKPCFPWVGGKGKLLWLIHKLFPPPVNCFIDVFAGSGTVLLSRPLKKGCVEIYNDYNSNLTNLIFCVKNRTLALLRELGFLPLNSRDGFNVLLKFFKKEEFTDEYLEENLELAEVYLDPPEYEQLRSLLLERATLGDVTRAANYYKLIRYSFNSNTTSFASRPCDIRQFFHLIWDCSRRFARVVVENKDFQSLIQQYDGDGVLFRRITRRRTATRWNSLCRTMPGSIVFCAIARASPWFPTTTAGSFESCTGISTSTAPTGLTACPIRPAAGTRS